MPRILSCGASRPRRYLKYLALQRGVREGNQTRGGLYKASAFSALAAPPTTEKLIRIPEDCCTFAGVRHGLGETCLPNLPDWSCASAALASHLVACAYFDGLSIRAKPALREGPQSCQLVSTANAIDDVARCSRARRDSRTISGRTVWCFGQECPIRQAIPGRARA